MTRKAKAKRKPAIVAKARKKSGKKKAPAKKKVAIKKKKPATRQRKAATRKKKPAAKKKKAAARKKSDTTPKSQRRLTALATNGGADLGKQKPKRLTPSEPAHLIEVQQRDDPVSLPVTAYESEALSLLAIEHTNDDPAETDRKIEQRLVDKQLGIFDPARIGILRAFKAEVEEELHRAQHSDYFTGQHGLYASPEDFDHERLARDFAEKFPSISHEAVAAFIPIAVYCYYLR